MADGPGDDQADGDGLPLIDEATAARWIAEAINRPPDPKAWVSLMVNLRWAGELERRGAQNPDLPRGMTSTELVIRAIWGFTQSQPDLMAPDGAAAIMQRLHAAVIDLADGRVSPMFKRVNRPHHNPGSAHGMAVVQGTAARAMSGLIDRGVAAPEAARIVAAALQGHAVPGLGPITAATITNWRKRLMQRRGHGQRDPAVQHFGAPVPADWTVDDLIRALGERASFSL